MRILKGWGNPRPWVGVTNIMKHGLFYRHFKYQDGDGVNGCYELMHLAEATETGERMVVYRPCYKLPDLHEEAVTALVRTERNFNEQVERDGIVHESRFRLVEDPATIELCSKSIDALYGTSC